MDGARRATDHAGLGTADRRAYLSYMDSVTRAGILADALARRDHVRHNASRQLTDWRRTYAARQRSQPQSYHEFVDA